MADFKDAISRICEVFKIPTLFPEQIEAIKVVLSKKSVYASLPTGYGKSMIFYALPLAFDVIHGQPQVTSSVIIISPLQSLMEDQVSYLKSLNLPAIALHEDLDESTLQRVERGEFMYVFSSPEKMLSTSRWRTVLSNEYYRKSLVAIAIDEAHCISQWGLPGSMGASSIPFRTWYGNLGEMNSLVPEKIPSVVLTATASKSTKKAIFKTLNLKKDTHIIERSPEKPNICFSVQYLDKNVPVVSVFLSIIEDLKKFKASCDRTMIFCQTRNQCAVVYGTFKEHLRKYFFLDESKNPKERLVEMFHAGTPTSVKKHIMENISKPDGHIRVIACTIAFGMGVNIQGVHKVIHFGPSKNIESYVQECGRAGRDGKSSKCYLLFNGLMAARCEEDIKEYLEDDSVCRRQQIFQHFPGNFTSITSGHNCCDVCAKTCGCGDASCAKQAFLTIGESKPNENVYSEVRVVDEKQKKELAKALEIYRKKWVSLVSQGAVVIPSIVFEFSSFQIQQVLENCSKIKTLKHIEHFVEVWRREHSIAILEAMNDVFGDIENIDTIEEDSVTDEELEQWNELRDDSELNFISDSVLMELDSQVSDLISGGSTENQSASSQIERLLGLQDNSAS